MIDLVCEKCGSNDIEFTAYGRWNVHEQDYDWEPSDAYCNNCEDLTTIKEEIIDEDKSGQ